jgi:hypothetical protein
MVAGGAAWVMAGGWAACGSGWPTLAISLGWMIGGHSAATAGSMFHRRYFWLSMWNRMKA